MFEFISRWFARRRSRKEMLDAWRRTASTGDLCFFIHSRGKRIEGKITTRLGEFVVIKPLRGIESGYVEAAIEIKNVYPL